MNPTNAVVQATQGTMLLEANRRATIRYACSMEATSHPLDEVESIAWGAVVDDISVGGVGITLCYPFKPGAHLAIDLFGADGRLRTLLVRVVHVRDRFDGVWHLGCEFIHPISERELENLT